MTKHAYPYSRYLIVAGILSVLGQITAIAFMLYTNPFTTFIFMTFGSAMILLGIAIFVYTMYKDIKEREERVAEMSFDAKEIIFRQGDVGDRLYVVKSGEVEVFREDPEKGEIPVARLGTGEYFGEMALLTDAARNASVRAVTAVTTLAIEQHDFHSLYASIPSLKRSVEAVMRKRRN